MTCPRCGQRLPGPPAGRWSRFLSWWRDPWNTSIIWAVLFAVAVIGGGMWVESL